MASAPIVYLASASPRRSQLLAQIRVPHRVWPMDVNEERRPGEAPSEYVSRLAAEKARTLWARLSPDERLPVLGADTTVALDDEIFGKPRDADDAVAMLLRLAGKTHRVFTAVALCWRQGCDLRLSVSEVTFAKLGAADCLAYWRTGEPVDKAGGYAVQGLAAAFIVRIAGSYSGIMGLPLAETAELLRATGWSCLRPESDT